MAVTGTEPGIISGVGSAIATIGGLIGFGGDDEGIGSLLDRFVTRQLADRDRERTRPVDESPVLFPTVVEIQRNVILDWCRNNCIWWPDYDIPEGGHTRAEVDDAYEFDDEFAEFVDRMTECMVLANNPPTEEAAQQCFDLLEASPTGDPKDIFEVVRMGFALPGLLRGPGPVPTPPPVTTPPGTVPGSVPGGVIRGRDRPSPTEPEISGPPGTRPLPPFMEPLPQIEVDFPLPGDLFPDVPFVELEEIPTDTLPARRDEIPLETAPRGPEALPDFDPGTRPTRAKPSVEPPIPEIEVPVSVPQPAPPAPAPAGVGLPGQIAIGSVIGAGISIAARARTRDAPPGFSPVATPQQPQIPLAQPQAQPQRLTQREAQREREREKECIEDLETPRLLCKEGYFRETATDTDFTTWRVRECQTGENLFEI